MATAAGRPSSTASSRLRIFIRPKVSVERASRPCAGKPVGASCRCVRCRERHLRHQIGWRLKVCDRLRVQQIVVGFIETETAQQAAREAAALRSEENTSELQSLMRISYAVFCLKNKKQKISN